MSEYYKTRKKSAVVSKSGIGKRTDNRFLVPNSRITLYKKKFLGIQKKLDCKVSIVNLSVKGLQVLTTNAFNPGDEFNISITVPIFPSAMSIRAKVVWCKLFKKKDNETYYRIGFRFIKLSEELEYKLKQLDIHHT